MVFCSQPAGIVPGGVGEVILGDGVIITNIAVFAPGSRYYLATTPGSLTASPPTAAGNLQTISGY